MTNYLYWSVYQFQQVSTLEEKLKMSQSQVIELNEVISQLKKDQEDLLILMVDQEAKLEKYKLKLKELGSVVWVQRHYHTM